MFPVGVVEDVLAIPVGLLVGMALSRVLNLIWVGAPTEKGMWNETTTDLDR
jgi:hypothetical protein